MINETLRKNINVDKLNSIPLFNLKEGDNAILKLALFKNSTEFDITGQTVKLGAKTRNGLIEQTGGFTISKNNLDIKLKNSILVPSKVEIDLEIKDSNGAMTTASFFITVNQKVLNDEAVEATNEFDTFTKTVEKIEEDYNSLKGGLLAEDKVVYFQNEINKTNVSLDKNTKKIRNTQLGKGFVAHRGLQSKAPENTLKSIEQASLNGFVMCELDPRITSDGVWVLMHDPTIDATTNGTGSVASMTYSQLLQYKIDTPGALIDNDEIIRIPTFEDAVKISSYYGIGINVDGGKFRWDYEKAYYIYNLLKQYNILEKSCISLPIESDREVFINNFPDLTVCIAIDSSTIDYTLEQYGDYNIIIAFNSSLVTDEDINKCNNLNIPVYIWDAQTTETAYKWLHKGVSFVETNYILPTGGLK